MNRARQDAITTEIMEIVGGAEALAQSGAGDDDLLPDHLLTPHLFPAPPIPMTRPPGLVSPPQRRPNR